MPKSPKLDHARQQRILDEIGVKAYGPEERAMGWYYYLEGWYYCVTVNCTS